MEANPASDCAICLGWSFEHIHICHETYPEHVHATLHETIFTRIGAHLPEAMFVIVVDTVVPKVLVHCFFGEDFDGAQEAELLLSVLDVDGEIPWGPQLLEVVLQTVREEDAVRINLHSPIKQLVLPVLLDLLPHLQEDFGVHQGGVARSPFFHRGPAAVDVHVSITFKDAGALLPCNLQELHLHGSSKHSHETEERSAFGLIAVDWLHRKLCHGSAQLAAVPRCPNVSLRSVAAICF
mmetsp:Transcript_18011/g.45459  ORF Transcript_18011/g.45459 Transcript_18011/m.45459 type:complete len:238 (+) Transcript_18011:155-868(+)